MKNMKIYLQYPWKFPDSSYYKNILDYPPKGIEFVNYSKNRPKKMKVIGSSKHFERMRVFKNFLRKVLGILSLPNIRFTFRKNCDLIHCAHCLSLNNSAWVVDTEVYDRIGAKGTIAYSKIGKWIIKKRLEHHSCKAIIAWSNDCVKSFKEVFEGNPLIINKIHVVPFALPKPKFKKISHKNIRILFVARWFDAKGGRQTLYVMDKLTRQYNNVECTFICPIPQGFKELYTSNKKIKILELMPQEKLFKEVYPSHDIFLYPGFGDSYGFAMPEALSFGLPIVTVDSFARKEIVDDGKTGFIIDRPKRYKDYSCMDKKMLEELFNKAVVLIKNKKLRQQMGKCGIKEVADGKFSLIHRNHLLKEIYSKAIH